MAQGLRKCNQVLYPQHRRYACVHAQQRHDGLIEVRVFFALNK
jgi:hypothetical protein